MDDRPATPPPRSSSSRTVAIFAVAVLIVIAIAGIVLATLRSRSGPTETAAPTEATREGVAAPTQPAAPASAAAVAAAAEDEAAPNLIVFAPGASQPAGGASAKLVKLATTAKAEHRTLSINAQFEAKGDRAGPRKLAQDRAVAVRQMLETHGVPLGTMRILITELPEGLVTPRQANRLEVKLN